MDKLKSIEAYLMLGAQVVFCLSFISMCEVPNWMYGPRQPDACLERWMFTGGVFFPSGAEAVLKTRSTTASRTGRNKIE